jgi:hypothetical protein
VLQLGSFGGGMPEVQMRLSLVAAHHVIELLDRIGTSDEDSLAALEIARQALANGTCVSALFTGAVESIARPIPSPRTHHTEGGFG